MRRATLIFMFLLSATAWADLGRLAYVADGTLWVKDLPNGTPRAVASGNIRYPSWSADGKSVKYLAFSENSSLYSTTVVPLEGEAAASPTEMTKGAWSPTANLLAYTTARGGLFLYNAVTRETRTLVPAGAEKYQREDIKKPLTPDAEKHVGSISWAPDGRTLVFATEGGGLYLRSADTGRITTLQRPARRKDITDWSWRADGRQLAFVTEWMNEQYEHHATLWLVNADGSSRRLLLDPGLEGYRPEIESWTPNGSYLLFLRNASFGASGMADGAPLMAISTRGGTSREIARRVAIGEPLLFSPDGRMIALIDCADRESWHDRHLSLARIPKKEVRFSPAGVNVSKVAWSPDGRIVACVVAPVVPANATRSQVQAVLARRRIALTSPARWQPRPLRSGSPYREENPQWSPDGTHLLVARVDPRNRQSTLWLINADGTAAQQVTPSLMSTDPRDRGGWFGWYDTADWENYYAWWQGPPQRQAREPGFEYAGIAYLPLRATVEALGGTVDIDHGAHVTVTLPWHAPQSPEQMRGYFNLSPDSFLPLRGRVYLSARQIAEELHLTLAPSPGGITLSSNGHSVRVPIQHSQLLARLAAKTHPLVYGWQYVGYTVNGRWQSSLTLSPFVALAHRYTIYTLAGARGSFRGSGLVEDAEDNSPELTEPSYSEKQRYTLALAAPWNAMSRIPTPLSPTDPRAVALARTVLQAQKLPTAEVRVKQAYLVNLGDGTPTLLVSAGSQRKDLMQAPRPGDYAFVAARHAGRAQLLDGKFFHKAGGEEAIVDKSLIGVLDIDNDGFAEIATVEVGYEWTVVRVSRLRGGRLKKIQPY